VAEAEHTDESNLDADRYAVFGNPVAHSKSPVIHAEFASQTGEKMKYVAQHVESGEFEKDVWHWFDGGGKGLNITVPFKLEAYELAEKLSGRARRAGAVNTLYMEDGVLCGDNTDGCGLVNDLLNNLGWSISGKRILLLGAGGAVRGVLEPILAEQPGRLVIANRTVSKAEQLVKDFSDIAGTTELEACSFEAASNDGAAFDLVINGTSAGLDNELPPLPDSTVGEESCCYDMLYGRETPFLRWAREQSVPSSQLYDGTGMLVEQAAESFFIWRGVHPETKPAIKLLREAL
jgi:shikimate dehydrogenase